MGAKLLEVSNSPGEFMHWCPGCDEAHSICTKPENPNSGGVHWQFNGDLEKPTFSPSINYFKVVCHYFIVDGEIRYCGDSTHKLAGQNVPLPDIEEALNR